MRLEERGIYKRIVIEPGELYVSNEPIILSTVLGSCVSVCLYDRVKGIIGMNHFLLSNRRYAKDMPVCVTEAGRYGIHSMELLINKMMEMGANRGSLQAKAFGGGAILKQSSEIGNFFCVGDINIKFIREFLKNEGIPLVAEDLGGEDGRVIHFYASDFSVYVKKIKSAKSIQLAQRDWQWWLKSIETQEKAGAKSDIWI